jgi:hypothetical protein
VNLVAQDISRATVSSSGSNNVTENGYTILQSVGQLSLIGSFELRNVTIVQGYQQSYILNLLNISTPDENLKLFPIPVENELHILFSKSKEGICEVELFDRLGRIVLREWILIEDYKISINLQQFAAATYIIKISNQYSVFYESIIKL